MNAVLFNYWSHFILVGNHHVYYQKSSEERNSPYEAHRAHPVADDPETPHEETF